MERPILAEFSGETAVSFRSMIVNFAHAEMHTEGIAYNPQGTLVGALIAKPIP
jgi:hypothetical protein